MRNFVFNFGFITRRGCNYDMMVHILLIVHSIGCFQKGRNLSLLPVEVVLVMYVGVVTVMRLLALVAMATLLEAGRTTDLAGSDVDVPVDTVDLMTGIDTDF